MNFIGTAKQIGLNCSGGRDDGVLGPAPHTLNLLLIELAASCVPDTVIFRITRFSV